MINSRKELNLNKRVQKTLDIVEQRDYNITVEKLAQVLIGGPVNPIELRKKIKDNQLFDFDGCFIANKGKLQSKKCHQRLKRNEKLQPFYQKIAKEFIKDYTKVCPWIHCIMSSGSMASNGLMDGDDIDLNIVVEDNTKYISWLLGLLLSIKYSIKYKKQFNVKWFNIIKGVICICVIWEQKQVTPFKRRDGQVAYELLLNSKVLYNKYFFNNMIKQNYWIKKWFPQLLTENKKNNDYNIDNRNYNKTVIHRFFEPISKAFVFILYKWYRSLIFWNKPLNNRIDHVLKKQHPYSIVEFNDNI